MRRRLLLTALICGFFGCSQANKTGSTTEESSGGNKATRGGSSTSGGHDSSSGGTGGGQSSGGTGGSSTPTGGGTTRGGSPTGGSASGGTSPSGGSTAQGGNTTGGAASGGASGGTPSSGGTVARGGATGGSVTTSGGTSTGGTSVATGGALVGSGGNAAGGTPSTGGASQGGGGAACTDKVGRPAKPYAFPQNLRSQYCLYPKTACSTDARAAYDQWKQELVVSDGAGGFQRVRRPDNEAGSTNNTVSEGIAYGMILAVVMDDQTLFDNLWKYSQLHLDGNGLMIWLIEAGGEPGIEDSATGRRASGSATDADEDMAWALAQAAQKWGGSGSLGDTYANLAKSMMGRVWACEVDSRYNLLNAGDSWGLTFAWNPSYFAPNEYRLFAKLDTEHATGWNTLITKGYEILAASQDSATGLVPAWTNANGVATPAWDGGPTHYQYDAVRVPFRIGLDYCEFGEARAKPILSKLTSFFSGIGAANIVDGYDLNGTPRPENTSPTGVQAAVFVGATGVAAMSTTDQTFLDNVYVRLATQPASMMLPKSYYYNFSWKVFSLAMLSGNLYDMTLYP